MRIECTGNAGFDITEGARAGARIAHNHDGGVFLLPAFADIWARGFLAHRIELQLMNNITGVLVFFGNRCLHPNPVGFREFFVVSIR